MKSIFTFLILFTCSLGIHVTASAQNEFAPQGAEWWYQGNSYDYVLGPTSHLVNLKWTDHVMVTGDTTISGISSRRLVVERKQKSGVSPDLTKVIRRDTFYIYDNIDTVFVFNRGRGRFTPLYIFSAKINDTICIPVPTAPANTDSNFCFIIDSIQTELYDGIPLQSFYTHTLINSTARRSINWGVGGPSGPNGKWDNNGKYTAMLGGTWPLTGGIFPAVTFHAIEGAVEIGFPSGSLTCYKDAQHSLSLSNMPCDSIPPPVAGIKNSSSFPDYISAFPNPTSNNISLLNEQTWPHHTMVQIFDIMGKHLITKKIMHSKTQMECDLDGLPKGNYFLSINTGKNLFIHKFIIQ